MKKIYTLIILIAGFSTFSQAQVKRCSTTEYTKEMMRNDPSYAKRLAEAEETMQKQESLSAGAAQKTQVVYTIPVVVHVVYKTATQNISDAQIQSQIEVLNKDFRRLNTDTANTPSYFKPVAADVELQFCLAQTDPNGNPTTGIERTLTTVNSFTINSDVKHVSSGGADAWDVSQYFNIWVCNLASPYLGFGEFPTGNPSNTYGLVVGYNYFGTVGTLSPPFNKGRTATHEIGHCFNLKHIWGDDGTACTGTDNVADTPNQGDENYGCPSSASSCSNTPNGDMFMNYMDYTDDACMNIFTAGQKTRMRSALNAYYPSLMVSSVCTPPVQSISARTDSKAFTMYPNPSSEEVVISYNLVEDGALKIFDITGKVIYQATIPAGSGSHRIALDAYAAGTYTVNMVGKSMNSTQKLVVTNR